MLLAVCTAAAAISFGAYAEEAKSFKIASDTVFKPFEYQDETGEHVGIDVDILAAIAEDQGFEYTIDFLGWDSGMAGESVCFLFTISEPYGKLFNV